MTPPLPLAFLAAAAPQATELTSNIRWDWRFSPWTTALAAACVFLAVAAIYAREQRFISRRTRFVLFLLRTASVAIVLLMLAQPTIERRRVAPPRLVVLVDSSASMDTRDVPTAEVAGATAATGNLTRREAIDHLLTQGSTPLLKSLAADFQLELVRFANAAEPVADLKAPDDSASNAAATRLGEALDFALRQLPGPRPAAIVAFTDGVNTAGLPLAEAASRARTLGVPLYTVALGSDRPRPDVGIGDVLVEEVIFPGDRLQIEASLRATGFAGKPARVILRRAGAEASLAEATATLPADGQPKSVRLALRPTDPGPLRLELIVEHQSEDGELPAEDDATNNRVEITVDVRDQPIRALLVDSTPRFEYRALKSLLERDPAIDLRVWLQDADADFASVDQAALREFPVTEAELLEYDVILLGDVDPQLLPQQTWDLLESFVSREGGGLAVSSGARFMPGAYADMGAMRTLLPIAVNAPPPNLGSVLPAASTQWRIIPTAAGLEDASLQLGETPGASAAIWAELPPIAGPLPELMPKPGAQVLAIASPSARADEAAVVGVVIPAIIRHYVGAGEVLFHATDETWRWRWRNDDRYFARYWGQAVRRLARGRLMRSVGSLATDRPEYQVGDPVAIRARLRGSDADQQTATIELVGESTPTRTLQLDRRGAYAGVFEATLNDLPADHYTARTLAAGAASTPLSVEFVIAAPPAEQAQLVTNSASLADAARTTGGKFYTAKTAGRLRAELPPAEPTAIEQLPDEPLWNSHWFLTTLCVTLGLEWLLRRRAGLL